ncbi:glycosyltransferase family 2 protein [Paraburkholderia sacchari]|uniref:Glycosyltransferase family 2 protein n=2 Tax=Paraburkholderia sacchari TaxID=159450 RepID=A0A8T6ZAC8_9BURK|nr:glycosyltransferase family 2 protein [Paraburkholderia sacchari]
MIARRVRMTGGMRSVVHRAYAIYREDGMSGLGRRMRRLGRSAVDAWASREGYLQWIARHDTLDDAARAAMVKRIEGERGWPTLSIVMPTFNPKPEWLAQAIDSVRAQLYPYWELCIADDASTDPAIRPLLEQYAAYDARIKVVFREQNGHICAASNSALALVSSDWVVLLDHDDMLPEHALYCVADAILACPSARLIYSDEDKIDETGRRHDPYFKCDWNIDLFYSHNMFSHLGVYHKSLVDEVGGFREGLEGSQDHDLALRCLEVSGDGAVHHIPRVLYHWRVHSGSTAQSVAAKPYVALAGERALNEHFARTGVAASAEWIGHGYRVSYALPKTLPLVSLIVPTRNGLKLLRQCIGSIHARTDYPNYEILIVDNGSNDPETLRYFDAFAADSRVRVIRDDRPFNYSALNNAAVREARGELVGLVNNDIEVIAREWLGEMVSLALQPGVGAVGAKLLFPDDTIQHAGVVTGVGGVAGHVYKHAARNANGYFGRARLISSYSAVTAACLLIRKSVYLEVGGLNEQDLTVAFNDVDFCLRVRDAGYRNVWTPYAELYHHESATRGYEDNPEKRARFAKEIAYMERRWGSALRNDPAYNPNLTLERDDFGLSTMPRVPPLV